MARYSSGFKARMIQRMAGSERISANALSKEVGVAQATLSRWLQAGRKMRAMSDDNTPQRRPRRSAEDKVRLVMKAEMLSAEDLGAFLRTEGIHEATLKEWREVVFTSAAGGLKDAHKKKSENTPEARRIRELERELRRKEKALAEAAALLVLQKKLNAYFGEDEDESTPGRSDA